MDRVWLENKPLAQEWGAEIKKDEYMELLGEQGDVHEHKVLSDLIEQYGNENVVQLTMKDPESIAKTHDAMVAGKQVIFQANLSRDNFTGYADFLIRVDGASDLGEYSYQVWDAKLSQTAKTEHILQVCAYSWMLEPILGRLEGEAGFYLGRGKSKTIRVAEYFSYFSAVKAEFINYQSNLKVSLDGIPDVNAEKSFGRWEDFSKKLIEKSDSLRQVAGIRVVQISKLHKLGIKSLTQLATTTEASCAGIGTSTFTKLKTQAKLQLGSKDSDLPLIEFLDEIDGKGFQKLPQHHQADVFFDIEGHPLIEGGLEYLWGATLHNEPINDEYGKGKEYPFVDWWAHDADQEKELIEAFIDWVYDRWQQYPEMRVYHYASYEITALKKLTGRYNSRVEKLDDLLRSEVFIDLYRIVTQAMQLGTKNYSIKSVEALYGREHTGDVANGAASIVVYEKWRNDFALANDENVKPVGWDHSKDLIDIRDYNIDDCESTLELVVWLREQQAQAKIYYVDTAKSDEERELTAAAITRSEKTSALKQRQQELGKAFERSEKLSVDPLAKGLIELLEFHNREDKPKWWAYFELKDSNDQELYDDASAIVNANVINKEIIDNKLVVTVSFDEEQPYREDKLSNAEILPVDLICKKVIFSDDKPEIELVLSGDTDSNTIPEILTLIARPTIIPTMGIENRLVEITEQYFKNGIVSNLVKQLVLADKPTFVTDNCLPIVRSKNDNSDQFITDIINAVDKLDSSVLSIQGPPGSGKTTTANAVISKLIEQGKRVGIMSNSHAAVFNLQKKVIVDNPGHLHVKIGGLGKSISEFNENYPELSGSENFVYRTSAKFTQRQPYSSFSTIGATVYAFVKDDAVAEPLDYLFVDEASQVALANLIAVTPCTHNIVLMGDQMQLEQPIQGSHPGIAKKSALEHLLQGYKVIPDVQGVFLDKTYRMHPKVCQPISDLVYESKLFSDEQTAKQSVEHKENSLNLNANGIQFIPVEHQNNTQSSYEELTKIKGILRQLEGSELVDNKGIKRSFTRSDVLIVAPYNMQVELLKNNLSSDYQIGTIDKFQGKEAQVVIVSMASSMAEESARGVDFLFDVNRLNVAVSRAKALALIVASPELAKTRASNPDQAKKVSAFFELIKNDIDKLNGDVKNSFFYSKQFNDNRDEIMPSEIDIVKLFKSKINEFLPNLTESDQVNLLHWLRVLDNHTDFGLLDFAGTNLHAHIGTSGITIGRKTGVGISDFCFRFYCKSVASLKRLKGVKYDFDKFIDDSHVFILSLPQCANLGGLNIIGREDYFTIIRDNDESDHYWILNKVNNNDFLEIINALDIRTIRDYLTENIDSCNAESFRTKEE